MRRLVLVCMAVCLSMMVPLLSSAFQNEPDGFRSIKWGTNISTLGIMRPEGPRVRQ